MSNMKTEQNFYMKGGMLVLKIMSKHSATLVIMF